ncbi:MAG: hypothetical protein J5720_02065 [Bacteroidaceae bacterium]|nr:hypothetical protein [Bacteroidaceae bacterium]
MKPKSIIFAAILMAATLTLASCDWIKTKPDTERDSTAYNEVVTDEEAAAKAVGADVGAGSASEMVEEAEPADDNLLGEEDWDISVRTFDLDIQDPGPGYEAIIRRDGKALQVAEGRTEGYPEDMLEPFGNVWQADVNFDGHTDVMICLGMEPVSDQVFMRYDAWIYNPASDNFTRAQSFRGIINPEVDKKEKRILGHYIARDGETKVYNAYYWQADGDIKPVGKSWNE